MTRPLTKHDLGPLPTAEEMNPWRKEFPRAIGTYWWFYGWPYGPIPGQGPTLTVVEIRGMGPEDDRQHEPSSSRHRPNHRWRLHFYPARVAPFMPRPAGG